MIDLRCSPQDLLLIQAAPRMTVWGHLTLLPLAEILANPKYFLSSQSRLYPGDEIKLCRLTSTRTNDKAAKILESCIVLVGPVTGAGVELIPRYPGIETFGEAAKSFEERYAATLARAEAKVVDPPKLAPEQLNEKRDAFIRTIAPEVALPSPLTAAPEPAPAPEPPVPTLRAERYAPNGIRAWRVVDDTGRVVATKMTERQAKIMAGEISAAEPEPATAA